MMQKLTILTALVAILKALPVEKNDLIDLSQVDLVELTDLIFAPPVEASDHLTSTLNHIKGTSSHITDKLNSGAIFVSHFVDSQKHAAIGTAFLPIEASANAAAIGGAIPAAAAVKGSLIGSAIATPIILSSFALPGLAASKTAAILAVPAVLAQGLETKIQASSHRLIKVGTNALKKGVVGVVSTAGLLKKGAIGLASKGALAAKNGAVVAGKLILRPIAYIAGSQLKAIGTGLKLGGTVVGATGAGINKVGNVAKYAGLGSIGLGASAIGWGLDKITIDDHSQEIHKLHNF